MQWFDSNEGRELLADELGLLMPLLVRCPGRRVCYILPNEHAAMHAPTTLMPMETRMWCDEIGWHLDGRTDAAAPPLSAGTADLVIAAHVVAGLPEPSTRVEIIHRLLASGGNAFFIELYPVSMFRRRWGGKGLHSLTPGRMRRLLVDAGLNVASSYALRPRSSADSTGLLLRHNWRLPSWLPLRAYAIHVRKTEAGMTLVGQARGSLSMGTGA